MNEFHDLESSFPIDSADKDDRSDPNDKSCGNETNLHRSTTTSTSTTGQKISHLYTLGKYRLFASVYNHVHSFPTTLPQFSSSPVFFFGRCYTDEIELSDVFPPRRNDGKDRISEESNATDTSPVSFHVIKREDHKNTYSKQLTNVSHPTSSVEEDSDITSPTVRRAQFISDFLLDFHSLIYFSYRKDFPALSSSQLTTDIGWGCMLRTGQMMLANVFIRHFLGEEWRLNEHDQSNPYSMYRQILRWFTDGPSPNYPYSIHNIIERNLTMKSKTMNNHGHESIHTKNNSVEWFSPSRIGEILRELLIEHCPEHLSMFVARNGTIYLDRILAEATRNNSTIKSMSSPQVKPTTEKNIFNISKVPKDGQSNDELNRDENLISPNSISEESWNSLFLFFPLRLGVENLNKVYIESLKKLLAFPYSVGFIGGRPKQSLYLVGFQDDNLFYLDPHWVCLSVLADEDFSDESYHCSIPPKIPFLNIDPSLAMGFYCRNKIEFEDLCSRIKELSLSDNGSAAILAIEKHSLT